MTFQDNIREVRRGLKVGGRRGRNIVFSALSPNIDRFYQGQPWAINSTEPIDWECYDNDELWDDANEAL